MDSIRICQIVFFSIIVIASIVMWNSFVREGLENVEGAPVIKANKSSSIESQTMTASAITVSNTARNPCGQMCSTGQTCTTVGTESGEPSGYCCLSTVELESDFGTNINCSPSQLKNVAPAAQTSSSDAFDKRLPTSKNEDLPRDNRVSSSLVQA